MGTAAFRSALCIVLVLAGGSLTSVARAELALFLTSSANLQALPVGQKVSFEVQLAGLAAGQELDFLAATVHYTDALLGPPTVGKGEIVPQLLFHPADFLSAEDAGLADASFLTYSPDSAHHIRGNGVFFRFEVEVLQPGSGQLWFDYVDASRFNPDAPQESIFVVPAMGPALHFEAIPEPAALVLLVTAALAAMVYFLTRGKSPLAAFPRPSRPR